jgi:hypothetical protein
VRALLTVAVLTCCAHASGAEPPGPGETFDRLRSLVGEWKAELPGFGQMTNSIRLVSNGKAIEETIGTPADNETSIYMRDGDRLLLTHFCTLTPDGHIARLTTKVLTGNPDQLEFNFVGASNLHQPSAPHMKRVVITFEDGGHFSEKWTEIASGKETVFDLKFHRQ